MTNISISKLLIANRGEIACRIIRTAQRMGIECVAVYSDADKNAQHVKLADEAWYIGPSPAQESYLRSDKILQVAKQSGANAVHPGYGFLSENAEFAATCQQNNIIFVGPPVGAIEAMGSKSEAKRIMHEAEVPLVSGYHGDEQSESLLQAEADKIGYPLLIKATAGGGGKGMRVVESSAEFIDALNSCKREAKSSFGDDKVLIEKYLTKPRHVEIQVFADSLGNAVHLFERDCSVQRRHQKVIEEAPAPGLTEETREQMGQVAIKAAKAIGYQGAGTVEFLYDEDGSFYFMEMNTRLQVEHPVTEMITGLDLVEWQIVVANGNPLPKQQAQLSINGHAFEARIYAEDPNNDFLPATGLISYMGTPSTNQHVRVDSGIISGDQVSVYYDPMIAKLIVWDTDRNAALARLRGALADFHVAGLTTNIEFLHQLASNDSFIGADLDTHFLDKHGEELILGQQPADDAILAAASLKVMLDQSGNQQQLHSVDPFSPWSDKSGWRLNEDNYHQIDLVYGSGHYEITAHFRDDGFLFEINNQEIFTKGYISDNKLFLELDGHKSTVSFAQEKNHLVLFRNASSWSFEVKDSSQVDLGQETSANLTAPMPGTVIQVLVADGDSVEEGQALIVMEAMKMEHTIKAHKDTTIKEVLFNVGDLVDEGAELISFEEE
ncbi:acetyl/propionyl/methylcrotonyl-CoA carboxylase subunit alpha [Aliikangiella marina]|uniref:Biotin carboxylase n=1 Tax=Aliikangiella marina TaxID=1712262 RepID=A0A545TK19_9GAMM|nr:acetyl/propionyl/methylcrotonyl-CoA carboxylase subunit alpha [Aliikangiella marina]TQV77511.1 acetyl/propionyl/methylcrotonyl-CoA carboxylase subunit alpha [Aliikangiella marina]